MNMSEENENQAQTGCADGKASIVNECSTYEAIEKGKFLLSVINSLYTSAETKADADDKLLELIKGL